MPSFVPGKRSSTAAASRCAVEWRKTSKPARVSGSTGSISTPSLPPFALTASSGRARSTSCPLTFAASARFAASRSSCRKASPTVTDAGTCATGPSFSCTFTSLIAYVLHPHSKGAAPRASELTAQAPAAHSHNERHGRRQRQNVYRKIGVRKGNEPQTRSDSTEAPSPRPPALGRSSSLKSTRSSSSRHHLSSSGKGLPELSVETLNGGRARREPTPHRVKALRPSMCSAKQSLKLKNLTNAGGEVNSVEGEIVG